MKDTRDVGTINHSILAGPLVSPLKTCLRIILDFKLPRSAQNRLVEHELDKYAFNPNLALTKPKP